MLPTYLNYQILSARHFHQLGLVFSQRLFVYAVFLRAVAAHALSVIKKSVALLVTAIVQTHHHLVQMLVLMNLVTAAVIRSKIEVTSTTTMII